ncbi:MAG: winged helix-turn-helix domain-containing protein [Prevotella sp.]|jgi:hypothetical protein|nr:winged helix-turn-helix domain-containing protein [Prevotella sp.]
MLNELIRADTTFIIQLLSSYGTLAIKELEELTGYREMYIYLALGWLSKEDKVRYLEKDDGLYVEIK